MIMKQNKIFNNDSIRYYVNLNKKNQLNLDISQKLFVTIFLIVYF